MATAINHVSSEIQNEEEEHLHRATSAPQQEPVSQIGDQQNMTGHEMRAMKLNELMEDDLHFIDEAYENLAKYKEEIMGQQKRAKENLKFQEISKVEMVVMRLKTEIPSKVKVRYSAPTDRDAKKKENLPNREKNEHLAGVHSFYKKDPFQNNVIFNEFEASFNLLNCQHKQCLLCFALFPEGATIKKRLLMYWWIGEGFIRSDKNADADAENVLKELISKNFIHSVYDKCPFKKKAHSYKLQPLAHAAVTMLAERENFIDFDEKGDPIRDHTRSLRSCLVPQKYNKLENEGNNNSLSSKSGDPIRDHTRSLRCCFVPRKDKKLENEESNGKNNSSSSKSGNSNKPMAHVVFNLNEAFLRLKRDWFMEMKYVNILYLGRWDSTSKKHIEVEEPKDLEGLANLKYVKFLSLQGISGITEIPDSISKLWNLNVLDLRACHSLEVIPRGIGSLHNLTYLDLSECYLLSGMPKGLGALTNLVVLKGFEVQHSTDKLNSCTLEDLLAMKNLSKLSIHTEIEDFPRWSDLSVFEKFKQLRILTIEWGGNLFRNPDSSTWKSNIPNPGGIARKLTRLITWKKADENVSHPTGFPPLLEKLDLKCYPKRSAATWLKPDNLQKLNKLYIRGGELRDLGQFEFGSDPEPWNNVKTLRLKYLTELEMEWMEFRELFPEVEYLEKVKCPKLTMFPCNAHGVWKYKNFAF